MQSSGPVARVGHDYTQAASPTGLSFGHKKWIHTGSGLRWMTYRQNTP